MIATYPTGMLLKGAGVSFMAVYFLFTNNTGLTRLVVLGGYIWCDVIA